MRMQDVMSCDAEYLAELDYEASEAAAQRAELAAERAFEASLEYDQESQDEMYRDDERCGGTFAELMRG
jgi:hypothetical protein